MGNHENCIFHSNAILVHCLNSTSCLNCKAIARILFQPRQRGRLNRGSRGAALSGNDQGAKPTEAQSFPVVGCPEEMENVLEFYFTTFIIQQKCLKLHIYTMLWCRGDRL